jgi:predicted DNA-binding transcriptional regulator YafY
MRASRLLSILILLQVRGRVSATDLAAEFEVSARTIYRDMDQLSAAGVPVYAERGRSGGFALLDGYRTRLTGFTPSEAHALLLAGIGSAAADLGLGEDLAAAQLKLMASLPAESGAGAQRVAARFHLDPAQWYTRAEAVTHLPALARAVWDERRIRVRYESWKAVVTRTLDPLGLVLKGGAWYLVAAVKNQPRTYRAANILDLAVTEARARRPARFSLARYWSEWSRDFEKRLLRERARVRLSPDGARRLRELAPAAAASIDAATPQRDGWIEADIPIESVAHAAGVLLSLGADVRVLEPAALRTEIRDRARRVVALYAARR